MPQAASLLPHPLPLMVSVLLLLIAARALGELAERWGQPAMLGEILAGVLLGPSVLGWVQPTVELHALSDLGVFLLIVLAGLDLDPGAIRQSVAGRSAWIPVAGFAVPLVLGLAVGGAFHLDLMRTLFLGLCVAITALPVSVRTLLDLDLLKTDLGDRVIAAAIFNDTVSLLLLGVVLNIAATADAPVVLVLSVLTQAGKAAAFMLLVVLASRGLQALTARVPRFYRVVARAIQALKGKESLFATTILFVLLFAGASELVGLHFIVGAFFGAMLLSHEILGRANFEHVQGTTSAVTMGFLAPIFFGVLGLEFDASALVRWGLAAAVLAAAFAGKVAGGYAGGRLAGLARDDALAVGAALNGRGIMELVIANIALAKGFIGPGLFSIVVLMGLVTTAVTPPLLRGALGRRPAAARAGPPGP